MASMLYDYAYRMEKERYQIELEDFENILEFELENDEQDEEIIKIIKENIFFIKEKLNDYN